MFHTFTGFVSKFIHRVLGRFHLNSQALFFEGVRIQGFSAANHLPSTRLGSQEEGHTLCTLREPSPLLRVFCSLGGPLHPYSGSLKYRGLLTLPGQPSAPRGMESWGQKASVSGSSGEQFWETFYSIP